MTVTDAQTRIYLDVCTLCRPYDDQNLMRIRLETDAFYLILQHIQNGRYTMIVSPVHFREVAAIEETRERQKSLPSCTDMAPPLRVISVPSENGRKRCRPEDLALPMPRTWPLRKPQLTCSLRVMIDYSGNVGELQCICGP